MEGMGFNATEPGVRGGEGNVTGDALPSIISELTPPDEPIAIPLACICGVPGPDVPPCVLIPDADPRLVVDELALTVTLPSPPPKRFAKVRLAKGDGRAARLALFEKAPSVFCRVFDRAAGWACKSIEPRGRGVLVDGTGLPWLTPFGTPLGFMTLFDITAFSWTIVTTMLLKEPTPRSAESFS